MKYCSVVPQEVVELYGTDFRSNPIGTGPFKFKLWEENIKLVFRKNHDYFEVDNKNQKLPYLTGQKKYDVHVFYQLFCGRIC